MPINLRHMSFNEALVAAKERTKVDFGRELTNEEIANRSGLSTAQVSRYFNKYDDYTPSPAIVPVLCRALGNTILTDWGTAQVSDLRSTLVIESPDDILQAALRAGANYGDLSRKTLKALEDGVITVEEAKSLQAQLEANSKFTHDFAAALEVVILNGGACPVYASENMETRQ